LISKPNTILFSILFCFLGYFVGNVSASWFGLLLPWNGLGASLSVFCLEVGGLMEYGRSPKQWFRYIFLMKRGIILGFIVEAMKVGS
jgi:hypothetical protein